MRKSIVLTSCLFILLLIFVAAAAGGADSSPRVSITGAVRQPVVLSLEDLSRFQSLSVRLNEVDSARHFHGSFHYQGVPLRTLLELAHIHKEEASFSKYLDVAVVVRNAQGKQAVFSWGELFLNPDGKHILIADGKENQGVAKEGRFTLVIPNDLSSDRNVKGITSIEVVSLKPPPKVYIIGVGCADTGLITLEALNHLNKTDVVVCSADIANRFAFYIGRRPILFDPFQLGLSGGNRKRGKGDFSSHRLEEAETDKTSEALGMIRTALGQGKSVALLEYGDPLLYGGLRKLHTAFGDHEKAFVPGISAFNAALSLALA
ncbi:MAG TPA: SAM-dependent methyltransferase [Syntrophales bacterium]|nr:SAM-dependent methyltransferase [Smithellaceae bacterium]HPN08151.1 SAM-dependent methyltransferase [Syntrophales bacterium]HPX81248.1 SAM-dependent methyltransferase [Syntrophales bacterium]HQB13230.1 SAM-dependent methyltransferase [Syntrophales bacterium]